MIDHFEDVLNECTVAFNQRREWATGRDLAFGILNCMGRRTLTGMLTASGKQFVDWTSSYRLFSQSRIDLDKMFAVLRKHCLYHQLPKQSIVVHLDDTLLKKTGRNIPGTSWRRDPLGPPFHTNFIWGQRFIQMSMALPQGGPCGQSRAIPIDFHHCPTAKKPKKGANAQEIETFEEEKKRLRLSRQGSERIALLRENLNRQPGLRDTNILINVDGSYTNKEVLQNLPKGVTLIGRIRKDTKLYDLPDTQPCLGRRRVYGTQLPTPEQIRQSDQYPWQTVCAWAAGKEHDFQVKVIRDVLWRAAGQTMTMQLVIIRPLGYRLSKTSKILYRDPAYLICTDANLAIDKLLQSYVWRWEIEVNFREEKTLLGCGQAQVRNIRSAETLPAFTAAIYGLLQIAAHRSFSEPEPAILPRPKWYPKKELTRHTTGDLLNNFKAQAWAKSQHIHFSRFVAQETLTQTQRNVADPFNSASFYMRN